MKKIADYMNGNVHIQLYNDGTRIMESDDDEFRFDKPTNVDVTITHKCDGKCPYCYLECSENGEHADPATFKFFDTMQRGSECAINLNSMDSPYLVLFLERMKSNGIFVNGTINQKHFMKHYHTLAQWSAKGLIHGIGISLDTPTPEFIDRVRHLPNAVIHVINGIWRASDIEMMRDKGLKVLILGYKDIGRGDSYKTKNQINITAKQRYLRDVLPTLLNHFRVVSFDNLAIEQLGVKNLLSKEQWDEFYQGDEGSSTFAIDLVTGKFARNSMVTDYRKMYDITDDIKTMFDVIKSESKHDD